MNESKVNVRNYTLYLLFKILLFGALVFSFIFLIGEESTHAPQPEVSYGLNKGDYLPELRLQEIGTKEEFKLSDFKGNKMLIVFWASWCPYCSETSVQIEELLKERDDIIVIGINSQDVEENEKDVIEFLESNNTSYLNGQLSDEDLKAFQIESFPTILFVDSKGIIQEGVLGGLTKELIEKRFESIE